MMKITFHNLLEADHQLVVMLQKHTGNQTLDRIFVFISAMGRTPFYIAALLLILLFSWQSALHLLFLLALSELLNALIKMIVNRPRPFVRHADVINKDRVESGSGFPSCHTQNTIIFWVYLMISLQEPILIPTGLVIAGLIIFSRLYLGLHYFSDVMAGALIGLSILLLGLQLGFVGC